MSDCCSVSGQPTTTVLNEDRTAATSATCVRCGGVGRSVERKTVLHHVRHELLDRVNGEGYRFCSDSSCSIVYYGDRGTRFTTNDLRELVTVKANGDERPICYCFGFTEGDARREIARQGSTAIPVRITQLTKAEVCACEVRNPAGVCCLGQVNQVVKRLSEEHKTASESTLVPAHDCCAR